MDDLLVESITKIANHPKVKEYCEPSVMQPFQVEQWMTKRVMYSVLWLYNELNKEKNGSN